MPMPVSDTANSIQWPSLTSFRARSVTSPCLVNLQALLRRLSRIWRNLMGSTVSEPRFSWPLTTRRLLFCSARCRADDLIDQRRQIHPIGTKLKLAGFDLREVENLVDKAEKMTAGTMHPAQRLRRFFRAETSRIGDHHLGEPDDGVKGGA